MTTQQMHDTLIQRTADSLITSLSLLIPESGFTARLDHTSYFTRYNMQGEALMKARKASLGALLCDYERNYGVAHAVDDDWFLIENVADAASKRLYTNPIQPVDQDKALEGASGEHSEGAKMFREIQALASGRNGDWSLSAIALRPFFF
jgi:hypothetical protein